MVLAEDRAATAFARAIAGLSDPASRSAAANAFALATTKFAGGKDKATEATQALKELQLAPENLDLVDHWAQALAKVEKEREQLIDAQQSVRIVAADATTAEDEALTDAIKARDDARASLVVALGAALELHEKRHAEKQWQNKKDEFDKMQQTELSLTGRIRLNFLQTKVLPTLDTWMATIGEHRAEEAEQTKLTAVSCSGTRTLEQQSSKH